jgi:hypothetical protein
MRKQNRKFSNFRPDTNGSDGQHTSVPNAKASTSTVRNLSLSAIFGLIILASAKIAEHPQSCRPQGCAVHALSERPTQREVIGNGFTGLDAKGSLGRLDRHAQENQETCDQARGDNRHFQIANVPGEGVRCWRYFGPKHLYVLAGIIRAEANA